MSTTQQDKPGSKPRQRSRKAEPRGRKHDREQSLREQSLQEQNLGLDRNEEQTNLTAAATGEATPAGFASGETSVRADAPSIGQVAIDQVAIDQVAIGEVEPADAPSINPGAPAGNGSIGIQTIANAYSDYHYFGRMCLRHCFSRICFRQYGHR